MNSVTRILSALEQGEPQAADQLLPLVYDELRKMAAQKLRLEKPDSSRHAGSKMLAESWSQKRHEPTLCLRSSLLCPIS